MAITTQRLTFTMDVPIPSEAADSVQAGILLGKVLYNALVVDIHNKIREHSNNAELSGNVVYNAQITSYALATATLIASMEGRAFEFDKVGGMIEEIREKIVRFSGELFGEYAKAGVFVITEREERKKKEGPK